MPNIRIPTPLRKLTNEKDVVSATGSNIEEILADLDKTYPGLKERICDDTGNVRRFRRPLAGFSMRSCKARTSHLQRTC